jgi:hypothetical protein
MVDALQEAAVGAAVDHVRVLGVGHDVAALAAGRGLPVAQPDAAAARAAEDAQGRVVLLRAEDAVGEVAVGRDAVDLRGRLVVLAGPGPAAVGADVHAAVVGLDHALRVGGVDPEIVVVAVRRADGGEGLAAVLGAVEADVDDVDRLLVPGIGIDAGVVPGALAQLPVLVGLLPGLAAIARAEDAAVLGLDVGVDVLRVARRDRDSHNPHRALGQAGVPGQLGPGVAAVGALPQAGAGAATLQTVGGAAHAPGAGVEDARVGRVHHQVDGAGVLVDEEHALPGLAAVLAAVDAALRVGAEEVAEHRGIDEVGVLGMDAHARDVARVLQADVLPGPAGIGGLPHAVAVRDVAAHGLLAGADVDHVGVPLGDGHGADRAAEEAVRDVLPGVAAVLGLPHAAACGSEVVGVAVAHEAARETGHRRGAATAVGADLAPGQGLPALGVEGTARGVRGGRGRLRSGVRGSGEAGGEQQGEGQANLESNLAQTHVSHLAPEEKV